MADKQEDENRQLQGKNLLFPILASSSNQKYDVAPTRGLFPSVLIHNNKERESLDWLSNSSYNIQDEVTSNFRVQDDNESASSPSSNEEEELKKKKQDLSEEEHDRKRRKKDKSKKHKKHKHKKPRKQKSIDDQKLTKLPSTIWIEESGLEFEKAFRIHRKPDYDNCAFGGLYRLDIALHSMNPKLKCLGLTGDETFNPEQKSKQKGKKKTVQRYWESLESENEPLNLDQSTTRSTGFGFSNNFSYVPLELPGSGESIQPSPAEKQNSISELLSKTRELNQRVRENPNDIQAWLALANLQSQQVERSSLTSDSFNRIAVEKQKKSSKLTMEKKAAILEQAVEKNPSCVELTISYMNVCIETMSSEAILEKWKKILFTQPQRTLLWKHYLMFCQSSFSAFSFSATLAVYTKCFTTLSAIQTGKFTSHSPEVDLEAGMVEIFVQFCQFLRQSGQTEKAVAAFQALTEFNCFCPRSLDEKQSATSFFETFWDSDVPRFGEEKAHGWNNWIEDKPETSRDISLSEIFPCSSISSNKDKSQTQEEVLRSHSEKSVTWLDLERLRDVEQWIPRKTSDEEDDDENEDPDRIVLFQDISFVVFKISDEKLKFQLICYFLSFLGVPIDVNYYNTSTVKLEKLLHILLEDENQIKPFEDGSHNFACSWSCFENLAADNQRSPDISQRTFIRNVFHQSLEIFSDKLQVVLAIYWLTFEKNILASEIKPKQRKQCYKAVRKLAKSLLKLEQHRNNLSLWFAFIEIEWINGSFEEARRVVSSLLQQLVNFTSTDEMSIMRYYHFVRLYCELEMDLRNGNEREEKTNTSEDIKNRILRTIFVLLSSGCSILTTLTPAQILKTHKMLQEKGTEVLTDFQSWNFQTVSHEKKEFLVDFLICYALFQYWSLGIDAAESVLSSLFSISAEKTQNESTTFSGSKYHEDILVFHCKLLLFHSRNNICPVKPLRKLLLSSLSIFPESAFFLYSFVTLELRSYVSTSIRRYFDSVLHRSKTPLPWLFAILYETQRHRSFHSVIGSPVFETSQKEVKSAHPSAITILPQTGVLHRLRSLYERAIHHPSSRHCVAIWRSYMQFEAGNGDLRQAKAIFYQSLQSCSWAKIVYLDAVKMFPELFQDIHDMLEEKELRIRTPLEELELLLETQDILS